ncbi:MAG TPA: SDR family oxidoreductase [Planctomycetota bacterium]|nr:SDR family oxidoreductase [Planctomycetota bacterium]
MDLALRDRVALVTGASSGIGREVAAALAREGAKVAIAARRRGPLEETASTLVRETGATVHAHAVDVGDADAAAALVDRVRRELGPISALVANAGGPPPGELEDFAWSDWRAAFDSVVGPAVHLVRAALPDMLARKRGCIVSIQSTTVRQPIEGILLSNALRPAVAGLFKSLALRHARDGVRFHVVGPGSTRTERLLELARRRKPGASDAEALAAMAAGAPLGRLLEPEEIAAAVAFLASDRASGMTGCFVPVDGGAIRAL